MKPSFYGKLFRVGDAVLSAAEMVEPYQLVEISGEVRLFGPLQARAIKLLVGTDQPWVSHKLLLQGAKLRRMRDLFKIASRLDRVHRRRWTWTLPLALRKRLDALSLPRAPMKNGAFRLSMDPLTR